MDRRQREARALDAELDRIIAEEAARQERIRREKEAAERKAAAEARRKAEAEAAAKAEAEREAAEKAEAERLAAVEAEKARAAAREAQKAKEAEKAAQARAAEAERKAAAEADKEQRKLAEKKAKQERAAAKKAEQERVKAEREAAKRQAEADKQAAQAKARAGKPVKHKGKNNMGGAALPASSSTTEAAATRLAAPVATGASGIATTAVEADLGSDFEKARGRLPYPVSGRYTIVKGFGRQKHPTLPHVETNNSGIDMQTEPGATVRSVFDGEVSAVFRPDGYNTVVVIRHGRYMTVYANLGAISVSNGQKVKAGQAIGTVFTDTADANRSVLHFEIRNQRVKENPTAWLR